MFFDQNANACVCVCVCAKKNKYISSDMNNMIVKNWRFHIYRYMVVAEFAVPCDAYEMLGFIINSQFGLPSFLAKWLTFNIFFLFFGIRCKGKRTISQIHFFFPYSSLWMISCPVIGACITCKIIHNMDI